MFIQIVLSSRKTIFKQWMVLWQECQLISEEKTAIGFWFKIKALFKYGVTDWSIYKQDISKIITTFQAMYYRAKQAELSAEIADIESIQIVLIRICLRIYANSQWLS